MINDKYKQLLSIEFDKNQDPILILENWEHRDYIEDVLCEHYDIEYEYMSEDEISGKNTLYFGSKMKLSTIKNVIEKINFYHADKKEFYSII